MNDIRLVICVAKTCCLEQICIAYGYIIDVVITFVIDVANASVVSVVEQLTLDAFVNISTSSNPSKASKV